MFPWALIMWGFFFQTGLGQTMGRENIAEKHYNPTLENIKSEK